MKKVLVFFLVAILLCTSVFTLGACSDTGNEFVKIGVLVYDNTDAQQISINTYYKDVLQAQLGDVEFIFSESIADAEGEIAFLESCAAAGCQGVLAFVTYAEPEVKKKKLNETELYYIISGQLSDEDIANYNDCEYIIGGAGEGQIVSYESMKKMTESFLEQGDRTFLISTGGYIMGVSMFIQRTEGCLDAISEWNTAHPNDQATYSRIDNFPTGDAWFAEAAQKLAVQPDCVLATFSGEFVWMSLMQNIAPNTHLGTLSSLNETSLAGLKSGQLDYLVCSSYQEFVANALFMYAVCKDGNTDYMNGERFFSISFPSLHLITGDAHSIEVGTKLMDPNFKLYTEEDIESVLPKYTKRATMQDLIKLAESHEY